MSSGRMHGGTATGHPRLGQRPSRLGWELRAGTHGVNKLGASGARSRVKTAPRIALKRRRAPPRAPPARPRGIVRPRLTTGPNASPDRLTTWAHSARRLHPPPRRAEG